MEEFKVTIGDDGDLDIVSDLSSTDIAQLSQDTLLKLGRMFVASAGITEEFSEKVLIFIGFNILTSRMGIHNLTDGINGAQQMTNLY